MSPRKNQRFSKLQLRYLSFEISLKSTYDFVLMIHKVSALKDVHFRKVFTLEIVSQKWSQTHKRSRLWNQKDSTYHYPDEPIDFDVIWILNWSRSDKTEKKKIIWCKYDYSGMCPLNFLFIFLHVFDTSPELRVLKLIVHRGLECVVKVPVQYRFQWRKTTAGCLERATLKKRYRVHL